MDSLCYRECEHDDLSEEEERSKDWLEEESEAHDTLRSIVLNNELKKDLLQVTESIHTCDVEVFNNLILKYAPKQYHYQYEQMLTACYLVALDNNCNILRCQDEIKKGENVGIQNSLEKSYKEIYCKESFRKEKLRSPNNYAGKRSHISNK